MPGQFYISNVGEAPQQRRRVRRHGAADASLDLFATFGFTHARFGEGTVSSGVAVADNKIPNTPDYTGIFGAQLSHAITPAVTLYGRAEVVFYGAFKYDEANTARQDAYSLTNFRFGARGKWLFVETWLRNAFDTMYVPVAIPYRGSRRRVSSARMAVLARSVSPRG